MLDIYNYEIKELKKRYEIINWLLENTALRKTILNTLSFKDLLETYNGFVPKSQQIDINKYYVGKIERQLKEVKIRIERDLRIKAQYEEELRRLRNES